MVEDIEEVLLDQERSKGFDPLGLTKDPDQYFKLREAEIKHGRLAMLAAFGWPVSELYHYTLSQQIGLEDLLADGGKAPSVLNGGLDNAYVLLGLGTFFAVGSVLELLLLQRRKQAPEGLQNFYDLWREDGWDAPGNYGFDPLGIGTLLCQDDAQKKVFLQNIEIFNGRLAMAASTGFVVQEYITGLPVVSETPEFFRFS
eukprot:gene35377-42874_t